MQRFSIALLALTIASAPVVSAVAQDAYMDGAGAAARGNYVQSDPAPIVRQTPQSQENAQEDPQNGMQDNDGQQAARPMPQMRQQRVVSSRPVQGVMVRANHANALQTVTTGPARTELRLERGIANVMVHGPAPDMLLLVDLPGGQVQLLQNGFYTFNAKTDTVQVLSGEADVFVANADTPIKVKQGSQLTFAGGQTHVASLDPYTTQQDVLPGGYQNGFAGQGGPAYAYGPYGYGAYDGFYGGYPYGPYYAWDYPYWGWGYPWGFGLGFGWGGGFYGGGLYRGGYYGRGYNGGGYSGGFHGGVSGGFHGGGGGFHGGGGGHR